VSARLKLFRLEAKCLLESVGYRTLSLELMNINKYSDRETDIYLRFSKYNDWIIDTIIKNRN
jgi:hypothetical protein